MFGVELLSIFLKLMFAVSRAGKILSNKEFDKIWFAFIKIYVFGLKGNFMSWICFVFSNSNSIL